jgi:hypothetical protein
LTIKATPVENVKPTLKRRVGYIDEEVSITRAKLAKMELSENMETGEERGNDNNEPVENTQTLGPYTS